MSYYASPGDRYRDAIEDALASGARLSDLHAAHNGEGPVVRALLTHPGTSDAVLIETRAVDGTVPTVVDLAPGLGWDEREAHDRFGITFAGHEPLRPLVDHDLDLAHWTIPVASTDAYQVAVGPIHAGVIESGHFRFHTVGERILHLDTRLFYKHRGLEQAAEGHTLRDGLAYAARACMACCVANTVAYAQACEQALGLEPSPELSRTRTVLLELERIWSHLNDMAAICAGVGFAAGNARFAALSDDGRRLNHHLTGHRYLQGTVAIGTSDLALDARVLAAAQATLEALAADARAAWRELVFNTGFRDRLSGVGTLLRDDAVALGATGPAARAAGVAEDLRQVSPMLSYTGFSPAVPEDAAGDVAARLEQRSLELWQALHLLSDTLADRPIMPARALPTGRERAIGIGRVESPRGATTCIVSRHDDHVRRLRLRTGSYANWPVVAHVATGNLLPDFPLINKSFELCYACADR